MLTAAAAAEVLPCHQYHASIARVVQYEVLYRIALLVITPVAKQVLPEAFLVGSLEEACRYYLVCVDILQWKRDTRAGYYVEFLFHRLLLILMFADLLSLRSLPLLLLRADLPVLSLSQDPDGPRSSGCS